MGASSPRRTDGTDDAVPRARISLGPLASVLTGAVVVVDVARDRRRGSSAGVERRTFAIHASRSSFPMTAGAWTRAAREVVWREGDARSPR